MKERGGGGGEGRPRGGRAPREAGRGRGAREIAHGDAVAVQGQRRREGGAQRQAVGDRLVEPPAFPSSAVPLVIVTPPMNLLSPVSLVVVPVSAPAVNWSPSLPAML